MVLFRFLLILLLFYYGFKLLFKIVLPFLLTRYINKKTNNPFSQNTNNNKPEGSVFVENEPTTKKSSKSSSEVGDYVDFEEIKD